MPRTNSATSLDDIIRDAVLPVVERASAAIAKTIAELTAERVSHELSRKGGKRAGAGRTGAPRKRRNVEMTEWAADRRARRVPLFVIEATGLDTKKKIVAKFGEGATFRKRKPLPPVKNTGDGQQAPVTSATPVRQVTARPPKVRKAASA